MLWRLGLLVLLLVVCMLGDSQVRYGDGVEEATAVQYWGGKFINPMRVAQGRWYEFNKVGHLFGGTSALHFRCPTFFDGDHIWGFGFEQPEYYLTKMRVSDGEVGYTSTNLRTGGPLGYDGKYVWCFDADGETGRLLRIDAGTGYLFDYFMDWPHGVTTIKWIAFDGEYMWLAATGSGGDEILKMSTGASISILDSCRPDPLEPITMLLADGEYIWAAGEGGVARIDRDTLQIDILNLPTRENCHVAFDGRYLWVSAYVGGDRRSSRVCVVHPDTLSIRMTFAYEDPEPGENPDICFPGAMIFDGEDMWIVNDYPHEMSEYITKIDTRTYEVVANDCASSSSIIQLIFDGCNVWGVDPDAGGGYGGAWRY